MAQKWQEAFDAAEQRVIMKTESTFTEGTEYERKGRAGKEAYGRGEGEGRTTGRGEDQTVRGEFSPSSERYGEVSADFGEKPYRAWVNGNTVTPAPGTVSYDAQISIHAPLAGGRQPIVELLPTIVPISIHAPREGGDHPIPKNSGKTIISIHAPREVGDIAIFRRPPAQSAISIHAPREVGDCTRGQR